jgi:thymidylate kinase
MLIVIEGPDGVGKSTLIKNLINSYPTIYKKFDVSFPTYKKTEANSQTAPHIRSMLYDYLLNNKRGEISDVQFQLANLIDKVSHTKQITEAARDMKTFYLLDRYKPSAYVYGVVSLMDSGMEEKSARMLCEEINKMIINPVFEIFLYADCEYLLERLEKRNQGADVYENASFLKRVCNEYNYYFKNLAKYAACVDATKEQDIVMKEVHKYILNVGGSVLC